MKYSLCTRICWTALATALALPATGLADITDTVLTIPIGSSVNMETGAVVASGGDLKWDGISLTPQGGAKAAYVGPGDALYQTLTQQFLQASAGTLVSTAPIPVGGLTGGSVVAVLTTAGHWAKLEVTITSAPANSPLPIKITTYGASGGGGGGSTPTISRVTNNSSDIPSGFSNSGISQGALFKIVGSSLADDGDDTLHDSQASGGLPKLLNNAAVAVTVGGTTVTVALYYATPTQIDGVMPSNMPTGAGTLTVTYKGVASAAFAIVVVGAAPGITTYNNGTAVAQDTARPTDPYGGLVTFLKSAAPGAVIVIWGSGFGATSDDDVSYTGNPHATSVSYSMYIGGVQVTNITYAGRSVYPGVSVFVVTIPQNAPQGCYVPVAAVSTVNGVSTVSNIATLPIHAGGGSCSDPQFGITGDQLSAIGARSPGSFNSGFLIVAQSNAPGVAVSNTAVAIFQQTAGVSSPGGGALVSVGGCIVTQTTTGGSTGTTTGLSPGTITVTGPGGGPVALTSLPILPGFYSANLPSIPSTGGAYVFNGTAGPQVGAFTATISFPNPLLAWTNQNAAANFDRIQALSVNWSGGAANSYVIITGTSASGSVTATYTCYAPQSAGQFTVPSYILLGLPAGTGSTEVENSTSIGTFSASGLDFGGALGAVSFMVNSTYN